MSLGGSSLVLFTKDLSILRESDGDKASINHGKNRNNNGIKNNNKLLAWNYILAGNWDYVSIQKTIPPLLLPSLGICWARL